MNAAERYLQTIKFGKPDRVPLCPGYPRESTLAAWRKQGLDSDADYAKAVLDEIGVPYEAYVPWRVLNANFKMVPEFEVKILEHKNGHYIISDHMGAVTEISDEFDESYLRAAKDFVTRKWHRFPVHTREDFIKMKARYDPFLKERVNITASDCGSMNGSTVETIVFNGIFWQLREWCGLENLCVMTLDEPALVHEMSEFWTEFVLAVLNRIFEIKTPRRILISEDMAYKAHSMISPSMTRRFILPAYRKWVSLSRSKGVQVIEIDSDGFIGELIPLWIEEGIDCCSPVEVAAYNDILRFRKRFGKNMAYVAGVDKRVIARGGRELEEHVNAIVPALFEDGGYIPGCDHGVPPDISWINYIEFTRLLAKRSGWL